LILLIASTLYDVLIRKSQREPNKLLTAFSAYTHGKALYDITENKSPSAINCLNGLRGISIFWIMFGHRILHQSVLPLANPQDYLDFYENLFSVVYSGYHLAVDTFFVMGALLMTQTTLKAFESGTFNYFRTLYRRYIRYTPVWAAVILYLMSLLKFTTLGPYSFDLSYYCSDYWWSALIHLQNYINVHEKCFGYAWYLGADFQLFLISPFLIYPIFKYGWKFLWSVPLLGFMSSIYVMIVSFSMNLYSKPRAPGDQKLIDKWIYFPTHARIGPWMLGIALGYVLYTYRNQTVKISRALNSALWIISFSLLAIVMFTTFPVSKISGNETSLTFNAFYEAFHRLAWASAVCWIIFACQVLKTGKDW
jgi:peptidoglycan/LPS O-acetylase OafA/YrhL